jgi:hypothetical protein
MNKIIINIKSSNVNDELASLMVYQCLSGSKLSRASRVATIFEMEGKEFIVFSNKQKDHIFTICDKNDENRY